MHSNTCIHQDRKLAALHGKEFHSCFFFFFFFFFWVNGSYFTHVCVFGTLTWQILLILACWKNNAYRFWRGREYQMFQPQEHDIWLFSPVVLHCWDFFPMNWWYLVTLTIIIIWNKFCMTKISLLGKSKKNSNVTGQDFQKWLVLEISTNYYFKPMLLTELILRIHSSRN